jgi:hypothetical protein
MRIHPEFEQELLDSVEDSIGLQDAKAMDSIIF